MTCERFINNKFSGISNGLGHLYVLVARMSGKGDKPRPYNKSKFDENFDKIFNKRTKIEGGNNTIPSDKNQVKKSKSTLQK